MNKLDALIARLEVLKARQDAISSELEAMQAEINRLKGQDAPMADAELSPFVPPVSRIPPVAPVPPAAPKSPSVPPSAPRTPGQPSNVEKFIGENLISKIGIAITILGAAIGVKYAIDHELISPATRIILGYLLGLGLMGFGIRLKTNYTNFSAVLLSGGLAICYFITYAAYSYYELMPQVIAYGLMVLMTAVTVWAALVYRQQIIALIGLVGAYAIPFLLSTDSENATVLFVYVAIINVGILVIAFLRSWKLLYYSAFVLTWMIFLAWFVFDFSRVDDTRLAFIFAGIYFAIFYAIFLAYKLLHQERFVFGDIVVLLINSFIFYGIGYQLLDFVETEHWLGLFTLGNAIVHGVVSAAVSSRHLETRSLFYFISGLVLVFITIAIPVQLDGNWVTFLWAGEAALLFQVARTQQAPSYERLGYALMLLAFFSLAHDWYTASGGYSPEDPDTRVSLFLNMTFLTSLFCIAAFGYIAFLVHGGRYTSPFGERKGLFYLLSFVIPLVVLASVYWTFFIEINTFWEQRYLDSRITVMPDSGEYADTHFNYALSEFKIVWLINYSLMFLSLWSIANMRLFRNRVMGVLNLMSNVVGILAFLAIGLAAINALRTFYQSDELIQEYARDWFYIGIRYISYLFLALILAALYRYTRADFMRIRTQVFFDLVLHVSLLWVLSSELTQWLYLVHSTQSDKLGLSILWGMYALLLISLGIWKQKRYLRIGAIVLFGVTLVKLFFYDISDLSALAKTIVFVSLGVLLLIISFLYQKYRRILFEDNT